MSGMTKMLTGLALFLASIFPALGQVHGRANSCLDLTTSTHRCHAGTTYLDLSYCGIGDDDHAALLTCLNNVGRAGITRLFLYSNALTTLPADVFSDLAALTILHLAGNSLTTLPEGIFSGLAALTELDLDDNDLTTLPEGIFSGLAALLLLSLDRNSFSTLPEGIFSGLAALTVIDLSANNLTTLPAEIFSDLTALTDLSLSSNDLTTMPDGVFSDLGALVYLSLRSNDLTTLPDGVFSDLGALVYLDLSSNDFTTLPEGIFSGLAALGGLVLNDNDLTTLPEGIFSVLAALQLLHLAGNNLTTLPAEVFNGLAALRVLYLYYNDLTTLPEGIFSGLTALTELQLAGNDLTTLPEGIFNGLEALTILHLARNSLTTLPEGIFSGLAALTDLYLDGNPSLTCLPPTSQAVSVESDNQPPCVYCDSNSDCLVEGEICCLVKRICEVPVTDLPGACGDPHMTGFLGQKFDFVGQDDGWYALLSENAHSQVNIRITTPVPSVPEITYITGVGIKTTDAEGIDHTILIEVTDPHSLDSACSVGVSPCLADGALTVEVDGESALLSPGEVQLGPDVAISAVNLPGACRSFGFEKYWERKKAEYAAARRRLVDSVPMMKMSDWILGDPTATNMMECTEYVTKATADGQAGLFAHGSEHASFQILTSMGRIRVSHGRLHQLPERDPTDRFDLPDHLTWQMNLAIDHSNLSQDATGILGETLVPTRDTNGKPIMHGIESIRGSQEDYRVEGPLESTFAQGHDNE